MRRIAHDFRRIAAGLGFDIRPRVYLHSWRPAHNKTNFGDELSRIVVQAFLARRGRTTDSRAAASHALFAIGSSLHFARNNDVIWGAGVNGRALPNPVRARVLDVRAVRGPITAEFLRKRGIAVPPIMGDPALLLPSIVPRQAALPRRPYIVVPHLSEFDLVKGMDNVVSPLEPWRSFLQEIWRSDLVIASALHAIVVAEAYGIPVRRLHLSDREPALKYDDYAAGTGRCHLEAARSVPEALEMGGMRPLAFDAAPLAAAFPYDLWP